MEMLKVFSMPCAADAPSYVDPIGYNRRASGTSNSCIPASGISPHVFCPKFRLDKIQKASLRICVRKIPLLKMMHPSRQAYVEEESQVRISDTLEKPTKCLPYCARRVLLEPAQCTHCSGRSLTGRNDE